MGGYRSTSENGSARAPEIGADTVGAHSVTCLACWKSITSFRGRAGAPMMSTTSGSPVECATASRDHKREHAILGAGVGSRCTILVASAGPGTLPGVMTALGSSGSPRAVAPVSWPCSSIIRWPCSSAANGFRPAGTLPRTESPLASTHGRQLLVRPAYAYSRVDI